MPDAPKPNTYVEFDKQKVWFVGYLRDRALEEEGPRECVMADDRGILGTVMSDQIKIWMGPRNDKEWLKDIYDELNKIIHAPGIAAVGLLELQRIRDMAGEGLGYVQ